jgi:hypothetical protein
VVVQSSTWVSILVGWVFSSALGQLLGMIGMIQVALHIPLLAVEVPANCMGFIATLFPIVNFDLLAEFDEYNDALEWVSRLGNSEEEAPEDFDADINE